MSALSFDDQVRQQRVHPLFGSRIRRRPPDVAVATLTLRVELSPDKLIQSRPQRDRYLARTITDHYARTKGIAGPFGKIQGYVFHSLPDRATRYNVAGEVGSVDMGERAGLVPAGYAGLRLA